MDEWLFDCPRGCLWALPLHMVGKYGPYDGVACPTHRLHCGRRGRVKRKPQKLRTE